MNLADFKALEIGDRIRFRSLTRHNNREATRKITGFPTDYFAIEHDDGTLEHARSTDYLTVRYEGTGNFYVRRNEIIERAI